VSAKRTTIAEVAKRAGVSATTVSHVLTGNRPVATATRRRVEQVVEEIGFRPNGLARSLRIQRSNTIALIIPDITNPFYPVLARGLDDALGGDYRTLICYTDADRDREQAFVADASDRKADGIVIVAFRIDASDLKDSIHSAIPVVSVGDGIDDPGIDIVLTNDENGAFEATRYLLELGHRRVAFIGGTEGPGRRRMAGYRRALEQAGIAFRPDLAALGGWNRHGGSTAMQKLLAIAEPPSAVFCANDLMAIGALDAMREQGLSVPEDLAIVGYDDIDAAAMVNPPLTTVANPAYEVGEAAGRLLLDRITGLYTGARRDVVLRSQLIKRESA
jgi:LacI family transcriptional regulator